jgi:hypothetical protein
LKLRRGGGSYIVTADFSPPQRVTKQRDNSGGSYTQAQEYKKAKEKRLAQLQQEQEPVPYQPSEMTNNIYGMMSNLSLSSTNLGLAAHFAEKHQELCKNYIDYDSQNHARYKAKDPDLSKLFDEYRHVQALLARIAPVFARYEDYGNTTRAARTKE